MHQLFPSKYASNVASSQMTNSTSLYRQGSLEVKTLWHGVFSHLVVVLADFIKLKEQCMGQCIGKFLIFGPAAIHQDDEDDAAITPEQCGQSVNTYKKRMEAVIAKKLFFTKY